MVKRTSIKTLNGQRARVRGRDGKVFVGGARVTMPDVAASNGVIHVINKVLIPRRAPRSASPRPAWSATPGDTRHLMP